MVVVAADVVTQGAPHADLELGAVGLALALLSLLLAAPVELAGEGSERAKIIVLDLVNGTELSDAHTRAGQPPVRRRGAPSSQLFCPGFSSTSRLVSGTTVTHSASYVHSAESAMVRLV